MYEQEVEGSIHVTGRGEAVVLIQKLQRGLEAQGVYVGSASWSGLAEEAGGAYKNIDDVVDTTEHAGISKHVVRFVPIGNIKG